MINSPTKLSLEYAYVNVHIFVYNGAVWIEIIPAFTVAFFIFYFTSSMWTQLPVGPVDCARDPHHFQRPHIGPAIALPVGPVYYSRDPQSQFSATFSLKIGPTILFTYLKIILLQCFQFSVSATISSIQTDPIYL